MGVIAARVGCIARRTSSTQAANAATVARSKSVPTGTSSPMTSRIRVTTRVASSECPPSSKKSSVTPTRSTRSTSIQIPARASSTGVRGPTKRSAGVAASGAGKAATSTLPLGVCGSRSSRTIALGTRYAGSVRRSCVRSVSVSAGPTTYAMSRGSPAPSARGTTHTARTPGCALNACSTSPGSIRNPWILTCRSSRPRNSTVPSARHRARSPVRYSRVPAAPKGSGTNRAAVAAAPCR